MEEEGGVEEPAAAAVSAQSLGLKRYVPYKSDPPTPSKIFQDPVSNPFSQPEGPRASVVDKEGSITVASKMRGQMGFSHKRSLGSQND